MIKIFSLLLAVVLAAWPARAANIVWANPAGGSWHVATNWSPNFVPSAADTALVTNAGSYNVVITNSVSPGVLLIGAGNVVVDNFATLSCPSMIVTNGGTMTWSNSYINGALTIFPGGQLMCAAPGSSYIYSLTITNLGTVNWSSGGLTTGGTTIYNHGLWVDSGTGSSGTGGGAQPVFVNNGTFRKTGSGASIVGGFNFFNNNLVDVQGGTLNFSGSTTNLFTASYTTAAGAVLQFTAGTWTDAGGTFSATGTNLFIGTTLNLRTNLPANLKLTGGDIYITGTNTFQGSGAITNLSIDGATLRGTNLVTGTLTFTAGSIADKLTIAPGGQFYVTNNLFNKLLYGATLINQGTVTAGGNLNAGKATIANDGLWQIVGDYDFNDGNGSPAQWTNSGVLRKTAGSSASFSQFAANFVNLPGGQVEVQAGRLIMNYGTNNQFGGTFNATGIIELNNGVWTDAGGVTIGTGTNRFVGGTFNLRTNAPPGLLFNGGNIFITSTNTFQNSGAITNLTLDGATLGGTNVVSGGTVTMNSGALAGQLTVQTNGQLVFATSASKFITPLVLTNLGTVTVSGAGVSLGTTAIYNSGLWQFNGDYGLNYGGVGVNAFTNFGTFKKISGVGSSDNTTIKFSNQSNALVQVDSGTLVLPAIATNVTGTLRLNGGTLAAHFSGVLNVAGGTLDGVGTVGANYFSGGNLSPGQGGAARMNFSSGLNLSSNVTLTLDGSSAAPNGAGYDTLSVTGAVSLANAVLQITALPTVPAGTKFTLIDNDAADAVSGTFNGLPENSVVTVGAQNFRIHYAGGTGNDVTLVRDGVITGPSLALQTYATNAWTFNASGAIPLTAFTVRASTNLLTWTNIGVATSSVAGNFIFTDTNAWRYARRFYNTTN